MLLSGIVLERQENLKLRYFPFTQPFFIRISEKVKANNPKKLTPEDKQNPLLIP
jgi:hypothetical protein